MCDVFFCNKLTANIRDNFELPIHAPNVKNVLIVRLSTVNCQIINGGHGDDMLVRSQQEAYVHEGGLLN